MIMLNKVLFQEILHHTVHPEGEITDYLATLKQMYDRPLKYVVNVHFHIKAFHLESSNNFHCSYETKEKCLTKKRGLLHTSCFLPFENANVNVSICSTDEDGYDTMLKVSKVLNMCEQSCHIIEIRTEEIPLSYGGISSNEIFKTALLQVGMQPGYYFNIPSTARSISMSHDYGLISYVAEFAGWSGILVGASLVSIIGILISLFTWTTAITVKNQSLLTVVNIMSLVFLGYLICTCFSRFLRSPTGVTIDFEATEVDFDMTICTPKYYLAYKRTGNGTKGNFQPFLLHSYCTC